MIHNVHSFYSTICSHLYFSHFYTSMSSQTRWTNDARCSNGILFPSKKIMRTSGCPMLGSGYANFGSKNPDSAAVASYTIRYSSTTAPAYGAGMASMASSNSKNTPNGANSIDA